MNWVPVEKELPSQGKKVLVTYKNELGNSRMTMAVRYEPFEEECSCEWDCDCEYDEINGAYYLLAGWWEISENHPEFQLMRIEEEITHWVSLPAIPVEIKKGEEMKTKDIDTSPEELAMEWCAMGSRKQAIFFNTVAENEVKWCLPMSYQMQQVAHENILTTDARKVMGQIGKGARREVRK